jgi:hypothetical protein
MLAQAGDGTAKHRFSAQEESMVAYWPLKLWILGELLRSHL